MGMLPYEGGEEYTTASPEAGSISTEAEPEEPEEPDDMEDEAEEEAEDVERQVLQRRVLFSLTAVARHKSKEPAEFIKWLDSNFKRQREEWATISQGAMEPGFFFTIHERLNVAAATTTASDLPAAVDAIVTTFERSV